jgi:hypothetical protein
MATHHEMWDDTIVRKSTAQSAGYPKEETQSEFTQAFPDDGSDNGWHGFLRLRAA